MASTQSEAATLPGVVDARSVYAAAILERWLSVRTSRQYAPTVQILRYKGEVRMALVAVDAGTLQWMMDIERVVAAVPQCELLIAHLLGRQKPSKLSRSSYERRIRAAKEKLADALEKAKILRGFECQ